VLPLGAREPTWAPTTNDCASAWDIKKAIVALAHRILVIIYHLLHEQQPYRELGPGHAEEQANDASKRWAIRRLEQLGYQVSLESAEIA